MRCFFAINLTSHCKNEIYSQVHPLKRFDKQLKWVLKENYHLTLKFLGETEQKEIDRIVEGIRIDAKPFNLVLTGKLQAFPNTRKGKILWLALDDYSAVKILDIFKQLETGLQKAGINKEKRPFSPHLTIARIARNKTIDKSFWRQVVDLNKCESYIEGIELMVSELTPRGAIYSRIQTFGF